MREFLDAGITTVMSAGDVTAGIIELRRRLEAGEITGPRLFVAGSRLSLASDADWEECQANAFCRSNNSLVRDNDDARAKVRELADAGVDMVKIRMETIEGGDASDRARTAVGEEMFRVIVEQAHRHGVPTLAHVTNVGDMMTAVDAGVDRLAHTPHTGSLGEMNGARMVRESAVAVSTTLGVWTPLFDADGALLWRDGSPLPAGGIARAGHGLMNARYLREAGAILAFGTDTSFHPSDSIAHELRALDVLFAPEDIVTMMTVNGARYLDLASEIGTLEPGKRADLVILNGDPLADTDSLLNVAVVVKDGEVVVDNR
jgi:imidazolonepropionase-like amidohydrolase